MIAKLNAQQFSTQAYSLNVVDVHTQKFTASLNFAVFASRGVYKGQIRNKSILVIA